MSKFRKKPVVIEAVKFHYSEWGDNELVFDCFHEEELPEWLNEAFESKTVVPHFGDEDYWYVKINTLEGEMLVSPGDWIIRGVNGELYPCKPDIFEKTYEAVDE